MHRFHCESLGRFADAFRNTAQTTPLSAVVELAKEESHHAAKVLRLKAGDEVSLLDGQGVTAAGVIEAVSPRVIVRILSLKHSPPPSPRITIATAIPKGPRADAMIEQLSQAGCDGVIPLRTRRSVVDPRDAKLDRFQRASLESAKQCGRAHLMQVQPLQTLDQLLASMDQELRLIAMPGNHERISAADLHEATGMLVLIGPEGGWSEEEIETARRAGCRPWSLGPHIMRIETAAVAAVTILRYLAEERT